MYPITLAYSRKQFTSKKAQEREKQEKSSMNKTLNIHFKVIFH